MNASNLEGRVALVTGGARGIGKAVVEAFLAQGASVVIADSGVSISGENPQPEIAQDLAKRLGSMTAAFTGDISEAGSARAAVELAVSRFGALDIVVNNAAILRDGFIFKADPENWEAVLKVNLGAPFRVLAAATPVMREQVKQGRAPGHILNIVSSTGLYGNFGQAAYASAKAGLVGLTRVVAMDMQRSGVTCNAVAPFAATRVTESIRPANPAQEQYKERALKVAREYVAKLITYLSTECAGNVTGQVFGVRGREVWLFSQPRPVTRIVVPPGGWDVDDLAQAVAQEFAPRFTDLTTDLEAFSAEPVI